MIGKLVIKISGYDPTKTLEENGIDPRASVKASTAQAAAEETSRATPGQPAG